MTDNQNFADHPLSIGELRTDRDESASSWTPREALISLLRDIDKGTLDIEALVCCFRYRINGNDPSHKATSFVNATPDALAALGLMTRAAHIFNHDMDRHPVGLK